jgi:hypothetical protein
MKNIPNYYPVKTELSYKRRCDYRLLKKNPAEWSELANHAASYSTLSCQHITESETLMFKGK